jgi:predicted nucleic acid-binding protein
VRGWKLKPIRLEASKLGIAKEFAKTLLHTGLLPANEFHDGCILAEAAQGSAHFLLTSDKHLLNIDREKLHLLFQEKQLPKVEIVSPRRFARLV